MRLRLWRGWALSLGLLVASACASGKATVEQDVIDRAVLNLRVYLRPGLASDLAPLGPSDPASVSLGESFRAAFAASLARAGMRMVSDPLGGYDIVVKVGAQVQVDGPNRVLHRAVAAMLELDGSFVGGADVRPSSGRKAIEPAVLAEDLVQSLLRQPPIKERAHKPQPYWASLHKPAPAVRDLGQTPGERLDPPARVATATAIANTPSWLRSAPQPRTFALVIGIESYRDLPTPTGARSDAEQIASLLEHTFGVPKLQVRIALDDRATRGDLTKHIAWLKQNVPPGGRILFYFSGHGAPEPSSGTSYLLPYDGDPLQLEQSALRLNQVLQELGESKAGEVVAIVDSCFSGAGGRSVLPPGARPLVVTKIAQIASKVALFAAATGAEISGPASDGRQGLFTRYLLEALGTGRADVDGDGQISLQELLDWVKPRVTREAHANRRSQTPSLQLGGGSPKDLILSWGYPPQ